MSFLLRCLLAVLIASLATAVLPALKYETDSDNCRGAVAEVVLTFRRCGPEFAFQRCHVGECCGQDSVCRSGAQYCKDAICPLQIARTTSEENCREKTTTNGRCGPDFEFTKCPVGLCCTQNGHCQNCHTVDYPLCPKQKDFVDRFGKNPMKVIKGLLPLEPMENCKGVLSTRRSLEGFQLCGKKHNFLRCPYNQCCNKDGLCGTGKHFCNKEQQCPEQPYTGTTEYLSGNLVPDRGLLDQLYNCRGDLRADRRCGAKFGFGRCKVGECCSKHGRCETGDVCNDSPTCPIQLKPVASATNCLGIPSTHENRCGPYNNFMKCKMGECCSYEGICGTSASHCNDESFCPKQENYGHNFYSPKWVPN
uniref:Chitin-binding type-1 domain-containing protein n=1 Tax=Spongospora subterranea TaxID=70186 RepID=A0A0H5R9L7_9EUKA|eukprot:CRZ10377.1 hypothetical protein [Spongospora subterranea]